MRLKKIVLPLLLGLLVGEAARAEDVIPEDPPKLDAVKPAEKTPAPVAQKNPEAEVSDSAKDSGVDLQGSFKLKGVTRPDKMSIKELEDLFQASQNDPERPQLVVQNHALFIDLKRELERNSQESGEQKTLVSVREEISQRTWEMEKLRDELSVQIKKQIEANDNLKYLVTLYETMKPDQVASMLKKLPLPMSISIMRLMNVKKTSQVLAAMDSKVAAEISRRLVQMPRRGASQGGL